MKKVVVVDYDPEWPSVFEELSARVWPAVEEIAIESADRAEDTDDQDG